MDSAQFLRALSFAAEKHRRQRRKDAEATPYINHPIGVASILAVEGAVTDENILLCALLHDTVEDTDTTFAELREHFGATVADLVRELTDDKSLEKSERKRLQIEHAAGASPSAKQVKIADKISNLRDVTASPPPNWPNERRFAYLLWSEQVVAGCRGVNTRLDRVFDEVAEQAHRQLPQ